MIRKEGSNGNNPPAPFVVRFYRQICVVFSGEGLGYRTGELPAKVADMWTHANEFLDLLRCILLQPHFVDGGKFAICYPSFHWLIEAGFNKNSVIFIFFEWQITWFKKKKNPDCRTLSGLRSHHKTFISYLDLLVDQAFFDRPAL